MMTSDEALHRLEEPQFHKRVWKIGCREGQELVMPCEIEIHQEISPDGEVWYVLDSRNGPTKFEKFATRNEVLVKYPEFRGPGDRDTANRRF